MKCFYHNDMDGRCAGSVVAQYENNYNKEDFFEVDYIMDLKPMLNQIKDGEKVYFVDYSFKENTLWVLDFLIDKKCDIVWCDHHTSSLELIEHNPNLKLIDGIVENGISGAGLIYMHLYKCGFEDIPEYIQLVSDYDCWNYNFEPTTTYFKLGIDAIEFNALDNVWGDLKNNKNSIFDSIVNKGKIIKEYIDENNKFYREAYSYESEICGYKALVVNRKSNSWIFGDKINDYPLVCVWVFNGSVYSYSVFSTDNNVDCSKIAEFYGGGGHKGAAGFSSDKLLFKSNK